MKNYIAVYAILAGALTLGSCMHASPRPEQRTISPRDEVPCNPRASAEARAILRYIAGLSSDSEGIAIVGQSCGQAANSYEPGDLMGFNEQAGKIYRDTDLWPGIIAVDYGHDANYTPEQLSAANRVLIDYWNAGGLVAVGFSPLNPWLNDESDLAGNPGSWKDSRTTFLTIAQRKEIDLNALVDTKSEMHRVWRKKLSRIADAFQELENAGVAVLFKPMQEQNGFWFWWGIESHRNDPMPYINLWRDMYRYFTDERGLDNILWLYSPNWNGNPSEIKPQMWLYPGDDYVDIVAPTAYNDRGDIHDYAAFLKTGKPFGIAEWGPAIETARGGFNDQTYIDRIAADYPAVAFWISWHDWDNGDGTKTIVSIGRNKNARELMHDSRVIARDRLRWREFLDR